MRMIRFWALAVLALAAIYVSIVLAKTTESGTPRKAVVVELFTSEGCSSCPPADELLGHLSHDLSAKNIQVIPLGFHVDYWNSLGWKDRFSSADFSQRQEQYARALKLDSPYTPEMVVDGAVEFVGNDATQARRTISQQASQLETAQVKLASDGADQLNIQVKGTAGSSGGNALVMLAITEDNLATQVGSGENGGRTLHHAAVVRELRQVGTLRDGGIETIVPLKLDKDWKRDDLRAVVFVQNGPSGKIDGASSITLTDQHR
ncbi:MAG TPA: DUF1223 domain-containing protein [Candidatus Angelobacter sp.]|jgi:hypothetical protein|nr:DUF1223 domain-containing protein [Candidatus Angelobacter sp.]